MEKTRFKRMSILQLDPERDINESETKIWIEKDGFKPEVRLEIKLKKSRNILV